MLKTVFSQNLNKAPLILIVDDDEEARLLHRYHLETQGYRVAEMSSGDELLILVKDLLFEAASDIDNQQEWPDLIMMDGLMPGLNGFETCRRIRALEQVFEAQQGEEGHFPQGKSPRVTGQTQILIVSSLSDNSSVREALKVGANDYITKPIFWPLLNHRIQQILEIQKAHQELQTQTEFINSLLEQSAVATVVINTQHKVIFWNRAVEELTGVKAETVLGTNKQWWPFYQSQRPTLGDIIIDNDYDKLAIYYSNVDIRSSLSAKSLQAEQWFRQMNGQDRYILFNAAPIYNSANQIVAAITTLQDLTWRKKSEDALFESEARFRGTMEGSLDAIFILQPVFTPDTHQIIDLIFIDLNPCAEKLLGKPKLELVGKTISDYNPSGPDNDLFERYIRAIQTGRSFETEYKFNAPGVNAQWLKIQAVPLADERGLAVICRDISQSKQTEETLTEQAMYDRLTGLPNRLYFEQYLEQYLAHATNLADSKLKLFAVGLIDLDGFKAVNDTLGHQAGDELLIQVGQRIKAVIRMGDTVARLGGDEFTFVLPQIQSAENACQTGQKILEVLNKEFLLETGSSPLPVHISASIGVSIFPTDGLSSFNLIKQADNAMYLAKQSGKNSVRLACSN